ncbi:MAG: hypothetical protein IKA12_00140 [Clostridia bacterium]|nr:hypothetical protein [Clostridia bacterium]
MKINVVSKLKIWLIITLVVIVAGMAMLGVFGLNNALTQDAHYEISVSVDQDVDGASVNAKAFAETYFAEKGIDDVDYTYQTMKDGTVHVYKFAGATGIKADELTAYVTEKLANDKVVVESSVNEVVASPSNSVWGLVIALGVSAVAIFVYLIIMEKLFATLSVLITSAIASVLTLSIIALTRIPAIETWAISVSVSLVLSSVLSVVIVKRCQEQSRLNDKTDKKEIANSAVNNSLLRFAFVFIALVVATLSLGLIGGIGYLTFVALNILVIAVSSVFASLVWTPIIWSSLGK